uniref:UPF0235 protein n=1 Tax=Elaeophora elaphi TaxID=1147741 RepID=A0A0R3S125_9BILA
MGENGEIILRIHAKPNAKITRVTGAQIFLQTKNSMVIIFFYILCIGANEIELAIAAPPRDGQANEALINAVMDILKLRKNEIIFDTGARSRSKILRLTSKRMTLEEVREKMERNIAGKG